MSEIDNIELWELKKFVEKLETAHGNGTSMITLVLPPGDKISLATRKLVEEEGTAVNIKSRVNRLSVITAIRTCLGRLKLYSQVPKNGLCIFSGTVMTDEGKERRMLLDYIPPRPITSGMYLCDSRFHTEPLRALLVDTSTYGFIIMDGQCSIFGVLSGNNKQILQRLTVDLPKKHNKGGQSSVRFGRLRVEKRHNYVRKVCECAVKNFIGSNPAMGGGRDYDPAMEATSTPNIKGLVVGGAAGFKNELVGSDMFDQRLKRVLLKTIDLPYGDEEGFNCAIKQSEDVLRNVRFVEEAKIIRLFLEEVGKNSNKYCFGMDDLMKCLEMGAVETILLDGESKVIRLKARKIERKEDGQDKTEEEEEEEEDEEDIDLECIDDDHMLDALDAIETGKTMRRKKRKEDKKSCDSEEGGNAPIVQFMVPPPEDPENKFFLTARKLEGGSDVYHVIRSEYVTDYFVRKYHKAAKAGNSRCWGAELQFVSDNSSEGAQFVNGFGGIGGILRYSVDVAALRMLDEEDAYANDSDLQDLSDFI